MAYGAFRQFRVADPQLGVENPISWIKRLRPVLPDNNTSRALLLGFRRLGSLIAGMCEDVAWEDEERASPVADASAYPGSGAISEGTRSAPSVGAISNPGRGGAMGDGDDGDDGEDDDDDDDDDKSSDDDDKDPEFDWTGLVENVPYVSGACPFIAAFFTDYTVVSLRFSVFCATQGRFLAFANKESLLEFSAKLVASARKNVLWYSRKRKDLAPGPRLLLVGALLGQGAPLRHRLFEQRGARLGPRVR